MYKVAQKTREWLETKYSLNDNSRYQVYRDYSYNAGKYITIASHLILPLAVYGFKEASQS
jgi:hypothetical protein